MSKEKIFSYFLLGLTALFLLVSLYMLRPFLQPILWALIFSFVAYPLHSKVSEVLKSNTISALLITLMALMLLVIPAFVVGFLFVQQAIDVGSSVIAYFQNHTYIEILEKFLTHPLIERYMGKENVRQLLQYLQSEDFRSMVFSYISQLVGKLGNITTTMVLNVGSVVFKTFIFLLCFFFVLRDGHRFFDFIKRLTPMHTEDIVYISKTIYKTVLAVVYGSIAVAVAQGILAFIGYTIIQLKYSLLFGVLTALVSFLPPFGAGLVWFPVMVYSFVKGELYSGIFMLLYGSLVISTADNFVRPLIMKLGMELPYIALFLSLAGGLITFGIIGIFLGPIIFTTTITLLYVYEKRILDQKP